MDCGSLMTPFPSGKKRPDGKPYLYYTCTNVVHDKSHSKCRVRSFSARAFENTIKKYLSALGENKQILISCVNTANEQAQKSLKPLYGKKNILQEKEKKLTNKIKKLIDIMTSTDLIADDIKEEYKKQIYEKNHLKNEIEKIDIEINFKQSGLIDMDIIQKSLQTFSRIIDKLSLDDQKDLMQTIIKEIRVSPYDPDKDSPPKKSGVFAHNIRKKWFKTEIILYEYHVPEVTYDEKKKKFVFLDNWLPRPFRNRTASSKKSYLYMR